MPTISSHSSRDRQAYAAPPRRHDWRRLPIQVLCVLLLLQGSPLFALQEGWLTARPEIPEWLPGMPTAAEISIPSPNWQGAWQRSRWEFEMLGATLWSVASQEGGSGGGSSEKPTKPPTMPKTKVEPPTIPPFDPSTLESVSPPLEAITLVPGWNFVSIPEQPDDTSAASVLAPIEGKYFKVWAVDNCDTEDPWKLYQPSDLASSDLETIDPTKGMWIKSLEVVDLPSTGTMAQKTSIHLCPGWNLIGFPLPQIRTLPEAMRPFEGKYRRIMSYDAMATRSQWDVYSTDVPEWGNDLWEMKPGRAYWVLATEEVTAEFINEGPPPEVELFTPDDLTVVTEPIEVLGAVRSIFLDHWTLRHRPVGETEWTDWATGDRTTELYNLAYFDPTLLLNGLYEIQLTAVDWAGQIAESEIRVVSVEGNMKIGNFTLSFVDLAVPVSGLDLEIIRTYDSRDKLKRDFGVGWSLDIRQGSYRNNRAPGDGWQLAEGFLPCDSSIESKAHVTTIRLSDREIYRFALRLVDGLSSTGGGCYAHAEFEYVDGPIPGATLEILGNIRVFQETRSSDRVLDLDTLQTFEPQNVRLTTRDKRVFDLDLDIGVTRVEDPNGNRIDITDEGIFHSVGKAIKFERDDAGRIVKIIDPGENNYYYVYNHEGYLSSTVDAIGNSSQLFYKDHQLTTLVDPRGIPIIRTEYSANGRLAKIVDALGKQIQMGCDLDKRKESITNRLGFTRILDYDSRGNVIQETDELGRVTKRLFNQKDLLLRETSSLGHTTIFEYSPGGDLEVLIDGMGNRSRFINDTAGRRLQDIDAAGVKKENTYDRAGNLLTTTGPFGEEIRYTYDSFGNVLTEEDRLGAVTRHEYDIYGRLARTTDPMGNVTTKEYNATGDLVREISRRTRADGMAEELVTAFEVNAIGNILSKIYPDGSVEAFEYTPSGKISKEVDPLGNTTRYDYDVADRLISTSFPDNSSRTRQYDAEMHLVALEDRDGRITRFVYDAAGQRTETLLPSGASVLNVFDEDGRIKSMSAPGGREWRLLFDAAGRQVSRIDPLGNKSTVEYDGGHKPTAIVNVDGQRLEFQYDDNGRAKVVTMPDSTKFEIEYDAAGRRVATVDSLGNRQELQYDLSGRLVSAIEPSGFKTRYELDAQGHRIAQIDANGNRTSFEYDSVGRLLRRILGDGASENFTYDDAGNLLRKIDANGNEFSYNYDVNGRVVERRSSDGQVIRCRYSHEGQRLEIEDTTGSTSYTYDSLGHISSIKRPDGYKFKYQYDDAGNLGNISIQRQEDTIFSTSYQYDLLNRMTSATDSQGRIYRYEYDGSGPRIGKLFPNGAQTSYRYDALARLVGLETRDAAGAVLGQQDIVLDGAGRRIKISETEGTWEFSYGASSRLLNERYVDSEGVSMDMSYDYDPAGNRVEEKHYLDDAAVDSRSYLYDSRDRLRAAGSSSYTWDANGNLLGSPGMALEWDVDNRLRKVSLDSGWVIQHDYDADGVRMETRTRSPKGDVQIRKYLVDTSLPVSQVLLELDGQDRQVASYVRGHDAVSRQHELLSIQHADQAYFAHLDSLGSIRYLTDDNGNVSDSYSYTAFGKPVQRTGQTPNDYRFAGEPIDTTTEFYYNRARWFSPDLGRWLSADPWEGSAELPRTLHDYTYVGNNPTMAIDPLGLFEFTIAGLTVSLGAQSFDRAAQSSRAIEFLTRGLRNKKWDLYFVGRPSGVHWLIPLFYIYAHKRKTGIGFRYDIGPNQASFENVLRGPGQLSVSQVSKLSALKGAWIKIAPHNSKQFAIWNTFAVAASFVPEADSAVEITYGFFGPFVGRSCLSWSLSASVSAYTIQFFPVR